MMRIAWIVAEKWMQKGSGIATFNATMLSGVKYRYAINLVERPRSVSFPDENKPGKVTVAKKEAFSVTKSNGFRGSVMLALGYSQSFIREIRFVWSVRRSLLCDFVLLNSFGSELQGIAVRTVLPRSKTIAIAHTHPNLHENDYNVRRFIENLCYCSSSRVVFNSNALKRMWEFRLQRKIDKGAVIHHGIQIPTDFDIPSEYPGQNADCVDVLCIGLFYRWKGQLALIEAWKNVIATCSVYLRLIFVGDGACFEEAKQRVEELGLEKDIIFCGFQKDAADFFNGADIAIHYPVEPEAFGLVLLEAMARGKPVIAPAYGGAVEIVVDGETGYLVQTEDQRLKTEDLLVGSADISHKEHKDAQRKVGVECRRVMAHRVIPSGNATALCLNAGFARAEDSGEWREDGVDSQQPDNLQSSAFAKTAEDKSTVNLQPANLEYQEPSREGTPNATSRKKHQERLTLCEAICRLAEDADLRKRMGEAGRERVQAEFSVEKMLAGYDKVFRELSGNG